MISTKDFEYKQILFVLLEEGEKVSFKNDNIIILNKEGKIKHQSTCYLLFALFVSGHICVTSGLLERAKKIRFFNNFYVLHFATVCYVASKSRRKCNSSQKTI